MLGLSTARDRSFYKEKRGWRWPAGHGVWSFVGTFVDASSGPAFELCAARVD